MNHVFHYTFVGGTDVMLYRGARTPADGLKNPLLEAAKLLALAKIDRPVVSVRIHEVGEPQAVVDGLMRANTALLTALNDLTSRVAKVLTDDGQFRQPEDAHERENLYVAMMQSQSLCLNVERQQQETARG